MDSTPPTRSRRRTVWRHLLAAYVLYHAAGILIGSIPAPHDALNRSGWRDPTVQDEFATWSKGLGRLGIEAGPARLQEFAGDLLDGWMRCTSALMTPFRWYQQHSGSVQSWSMFVAPHRYPSRLRVDVRRPGEGWRTVYEARSRTATWRRTQLDDIRLRSAVFRYAWPAYRSPYRQFCAWLALEAAADFPGITEVRVRYYKQRTPTPGELRAGESTAGEFVSEVLLPAGDRP